MSKPVVGYCRVSTDAQADGFGIEAQKDIIENYCAEHDMIVTRWFIDEGTSGTTESRPELDAMLYGDLATTAVIVAKSDRLARDIRLYFYYMMVLKKQNIDLISATEEVVNDDTGLGNVYKSLILFVAEQERINICKRTSGGRKIKASNGGYAGGRPPYGYKTVSGALKIVPEEAEVVKLIFELGEKMSSRKVVDELNKRGIVTRTGKPFMYRSIDKILANRPFYEGKYRYGKGDWVDGQHEPLFKKGRK